jgi:hypothetical protein
VNTLERQVRESSNSALQKIDEHIRNKCLDTAIVKGRRMAGAQTVTVPGTGLLLVFK